MKRIFALSLSLILILSLCACSRPILYEEETAANAWLQEKTKGYTLVPNASYMRLHVDPEGFTVEMDTGSNGIPVLSVDDDVSNIIASERDQETSEGSMLTASTSSGLFARAVNEYCVFNPYSNAYEPSVRVYQKDAKTFRIFFWLNADTSDFYPIPKILTREQYDAVLKELNVYNEEEYDKNTAQGLTPFNYVKEFMDIYEQKYTSDLITNPEGTLFYQYNGAESANLLLYRDFIQDLGLSEQDWRACYQELGYVGPRPVYQIIYCDMVIGDTSIDLTLNTQDVYNSPAMKDTHMKLIYTFCPALASQPFMNVTQK